MISLINFERQLIMPRQEALELGIVFEEVGVVRLGYMDGKLAAMSSNLYHYKDSSTSKDEEGNYINEKGERISSYYLYDPLNEADKFIDYVIVKKDNHLVDLIPFSSCCKHPFTINKSVGDTDKPVNTLHDILFTVENKLEKLTTSFEMLNNFSFNEKCNVHIGGGLIVTFNEVCLKEDTCTDMLQSELNNGWKILAVCVQSDQRRPDYILGRYNPNLDVEGKGAKR